MKSASFFSKFAKGEGVLKVGVKYKSRLNSNCNLCCYGEILPQMDNFLSLSLIGRKFLKLRMKLNSQASITLKPYIDFFDQVNYHQRGGGQGHPDALKKLGQKLKRGPQIEPHRLCYFWNRSLLMTEIHLKSNKRCRKWFGRALFSLCVQFFKVFSVETNNYCIRVSQFQLIFWINLISIHLDGIFRSILIGWLL